MTGSKERFQLIETAKNKLQLPPTITHARQTQAHEDIRALGDDVPHDDWRDVADDEVGDSHRYTQRILEDLYDDCATV